MRKIYFFSLALVSIIGCRGYSQNIPVSIDSLQTKKCTYFFSIQTGALFGDQVSFSTSTIHGVRLGKKLRAGAGVGFDSFGYAETLPVFGSASWDLFGRKNVVFVQMNYGWAPWAWSHQQKEMYGFQEAKGGEMFSVMIGYRINYGDVRLALLAGYRHQETTIEYQYPYYPIHYSFSSYGYPNRLQKVEQNMNRFAVSLSVGWR